jgi:hypothetical protein
MERGDRPALPALWPWLILCGAAALWVDLGEYHRYHTSDAIIPVLTSLYRWTPYYWECNRIGMLVPLLAMPFKDPMTNLLVQSWLVLFAAFGSFFLLARWALRLPCWPVVGAVAAAAFVLLTTRERLCVSTFGQPHYAVGLALGLAALLRVESAVAKGRPWRRLGGALALTALAHWVNSGTLFFLAPVALLRGLAVSPTRPLARRASEGSRFPSLARRANGAARWRRWLNAEMVLGLGVLAAGALACGLLRLRTPCLQDPENTGMAPVRLWAGAWAALAGSAWHDAFAPGRIGYLGLACMAGLMLLIPVVRRRASTPLCAAGVLTAGGLVYALGMGTLEWVALNRFSYKYMIPVIFFVEVALAAAAAAPLLASVGPRASRALAVLAAPALLLAVAVVHGVPSRARARAEIEHVPWDPDLAQRTRELLDLRATHVVGPYAKVWMSVFHANLVLRERGCDRAVWGVAGRCIPTWSSWGCWQPEDVRVAAITDSPGDHLGDEAQRFLAYYFPPMSVVDRQTRTWLLRPADEVLPPTSSGHDGPILLSWHGGFFGPQAGPDQPPHCKCAAHCGKLTLTNPSQRARTVRLAFDVVPNDLLPGPLWVEGPAFTDQVGLGQDPVPYRKTLTLAPGKTTLRLWCDSRRTPVLADQMNIVFHVVRFDVTEVPCDRSEAR